MLAVAISSGLCKSIEPAPLSWVPDATLETHATQKAESGLGIARVFVLKAPPLEETPIVPRVAFGRKAVFQEVRSVIITVPGTVCEVAGDPSRISRNEHKARFGATFWRKHGGYLPKSSGRTKA